MWKQRDESKSYAGPIIRPLTHLAPTHSRRARHKPRAHGQPESSLIIVGWVRSPKPQNEKFIEEQEDQWPLSGACSPSPWSFPNINNYRHRKTFPCLVLGAARKHLVWPELLAIPSALWSLVGTPASRDVTADIVGSDVGGTSWEALFFSSLIPLPVRNALVSMHHGHSGQNSQCRAVWSVMAIGTWQPELSHQWPWGPWGAHWWLWCSVWYWTLETPCPAVAVLSRSLAQAQIPKKCCEWWWLL